MLNHAVGVITGDNDVVKDQDPNAGQQALQLQRGGNVLRRWRAGTAGVVVAEQYAVGVVVQGGFHNEARIRADF